MKCNSAMGSIPIARSLKPVDAVGFAGFSPQNSSLNRSILDADGREISANRGSGRDESSPRSLQGNLRRRPQQKITDEVDFCGLND
jgi:hypothetical protein